MTKTILSGMLLAFGLTCFSQVRAPKQSIHFMQKSPLPATEIPYGANAKAGYLIYEKRRDNLTTIPSSGE